MSVAYILRNGRAIVAAVEAIARQLHVSNPTNKGKPMDILATLTAISSAITALQQNQSAPAPTSNFATSDVQSAISGIATQLGVTPVQLTPAPSAPAASATPSAS